MTHLACIITTGCAGGAEKALALKKKKETPFDIIRCGLVNQIKISKGGYPNG